MDNSERIEAKVGVAFQIADQYLSGQRPLDEVKEQISGEMTNIRPAQFEAVKVELRKRLKETDNKAKIKKLSELFANYLPFPYKKLEKGHPIRIYYEENYKARYYLVKTDKMEGEEATIDEWRELYKSLDRYQLHIKRQKKNFYPLLIPFEMHLQVEKVRELGDIVINVINKNQEMLKNGDTFNFLFNQRNLTQNLMDYLDLEERVLFPKALMSLTNQDFLELRKLDDLEEYVYIEQSADFIPEKNRDVFTGRGENNDEIEPKKKELGKVSKAPGLLLPALLAAKNMDIIYYTLSGEVVYTMGDQIEKADLRISEETKQVLLTGNERQRKYWYKQGKQTFLITYSLVVDSQGEPQGILKTKEDISEIKTLTGEYLEIEEKEKIVVSSGDRTIDVNQNIDELFAMYPKFKDDLFSLNKELEDLKGPLEMEILKEATVGMLAKSLRMNTGNLVNKINKLLESY